MQNELRWTIVVLACVSIGADCSPTPEQLLPPEGAVVDASGVVVVRRDNPFLRGNVYLSTESEAGPFGPYLSRRTMSPDVARISANLPGLFDWNGVSRAYLWSDAAVGAIPVGAPAFLAPAVRLPVDYAPLTLTLTTIRGRELQEPAPPGSIPPPIGFDAEDVDTQVMRLDPSVLVLPVRVTIFVAPDWNEDKLLLDLLTEQHLWAAFDPGAVSTLNVSLTDSGFQSVATVVSGRYEADGAPALFAGLPPDNYWTQCDIQFRLVSLEVIPQDLGLDLQLLTDCRCQLPESTVLETQPVTRYIVDGRAGKDMLQIFIGGEISGLSCGLGTTLGLSCDPPSNQTGSCPPQALRADRAQVMFVDGRQMRERPSVTAHEIGHMLGLNHPSDPWHCSDDSTVGTNNLMRTGGGSSLAPLQCERARCIALQWLQAYDRVPPGHVVPQECRFP